MKSIPLISAVLLSLAAAAGCASTDVSPDRVAAPKATMAAAREAGADESPRAALHLKLANDEFEFAKRLIKDGDDDRAKLVLDRATADAELALELARVDNTRKEANDAMKSIEKLRQQDRMIKAD